VKNVLYKNNFTEIEAKLAHPSVVRFLTNRNIFIRSLMTTMANKRVVVIGAGKKKNAENILKEFSNF
jgi:hypothetical protein